jgi:beta-glucanase (GH16 family)
MAQNQSLPGHQFKKPQPDPRPPRQPRVYPGEPLYRPAPRTGRLRSSPPPVMTLSPDWRCLLNDNFSSSNLNTQTWWTRYVYHDGMLDYLNDEWQRYREAGNHVIAGSALSLIAQPYDPQQGYWPSGMLRSKDCFPIQDGNEWYFEGRLRVPGFLGAWTGFWIAGSEREAGNDQSIPWPPEIDQCEIVNNGQDDTTHMLHCCGQVLNWDANPQQYAGTWAAEGFNWDWMYYWSDADLAKGFHTYGLWYKRPEAVVYLDRKPILAFTYDWLADDAQPMPGAYLFCNLAVGGQWAGRYGVDNTALPAALEAAYLRVYQRMPQSTIGHNLMPV